MKKTEISPFSRDLFIKMRENITLNLDEIGSVDGRTNRKGYPCSRALVTTTSGDELYGYWTDGVR